MRGWFRSLGVGTKRNNRPLPGRLILALSGPTESGEARPPLTQRANGGKALPALNALFTLCDCCGHCRTLK